MKLFQLYPKALAHLTCKSPFHEDTKERKGLGTSPFGPPGLTTVPIPCVSGVFREASSVVPGTSQACQPGCGVAPLYGREALAVVSGEIDNPSFPARTPVRAKPDGLTPVALRAKRPLIAPSRPSASRLSRPSCLFVVLCVLYVSPAGQTFHGHGTLLRGDERSLRPTAMPSPIVTAARRSTSAASPSTAKPAASPAPPPRRSTDYPRRHGRSDGAPG